MLLGLAKARKEQDQKRQRGQGELGRKPRVGKLVIDVVPQRFCVEVTVSDLHAIIIPVEIKGLLVEKLKLKKHKNKRSDNGETQPKLCIPLRTTK